jgi:SAM-dependent methyltransferase
MGLLVCPRCRDGELLGLTPALEDGEVRCSICHCGYEVRDGIPVLTPPDVRHDGHDELEHLLAHKQRQASHFDHALAREFEITRPHRAPATYRWLLEEKFRRGVARLPSLRGATVVDICAGSGMDAEMLARRGARVIAVDISFGCAERARERAARFGVEYLPVVGDAERLPLRDRGVDIAYVHDGLHHLDDPYAGVREMARVAARGVSINEPADAFATAVAVRLGLALREEEAGNRVARLDAKRAAAALSASGFDARGARYFAYYRHEPGAFMRLASRRGAFPAFRVGMRIAGALLGSAANKLQVTGVRPSAVRETPHRERAAA